MAKGKIIILPSSLLRKQRGQMKKLLGTWENQLERRQQNVPELQGTKKNPTPTITQGQPEFLNQTQFVDGKYITRRQVVMNKLLTETLSDVLANNMKEKLDELGVSIRSIETKAWNKGIRIFYYTRDKFDPLVHDELHTLVTQLNLAISEQRLLGRVPPINFVYDETVALTQKIDTLIEAIPKREEVSDSLVETKSESLQAFNIKSHHPSSSEAKGYHFSAPSDMTNMMLGLDYISLYDEVSSKLERGRGKSSRMLDDSNITPVNMLFKDPSEKKEEIETDPVQRIIQMQRFLVKQKKKTEHHARVKRREELLARDNVKWDLPSQSESQDEVDANEFMKGEFEEEQK